jgi:hypothetical protein
MLQASKSYKSAEGEFGGDPWAQATEVINKTVGMRFALDFKLNLGDIGPPVMSAEVKGVIVEIPLPEKRSDTFLGVILEWPSGKCLTGFDWVSVSNETRRPISRSSHVDAFIRSPCSRPTTMHKVCLPSFLLSQQRLARIGWYGTAFLLYSIQVALQIRFEVRRHGCVKIMSYFSALLHPHPTDNCK